MNALKIEAGSQRLAGAFFFENAPNHSSAHRLHETGRSDVVHLSTDDLTRTAHIRHALVKMIERAQRKVYFCSFLFADEAIVRALCDAAERLRGGVYVLTALGKHLRADVPEVEAESDAGKAADRARRHEQHLNRLALAGVWLRSIEDCHAKFAVIDDAQAVVTSANATDEAYERNPEDGIEVKSSEVGYELGRLFAHAWNHLATMESTPGAELDVRSINSSPPPRWRPLAVTSDIKPVTTLRTEENSLLRAAIDVIDRATARLVIATYSFMGMETHPIGAALARATARGVRIALLVRPRNHVEAQSAACEWLIRLAPDRVTIHGHKYTHTKSIVADGKCALLWTGNLEAAHGWENGIEVGLHIDDRGVAAAIENWTLDVMSRRTHRAMHSPTARDLATNIKRYPAHGEWTLSIPRNIALRELLPALRTHPIEVLEIGTGFVLRMGNAMSIDVQIDAEHGRFDALRMRRGAAPPGGRPLGWLSDCTLGIVESRPETSPVDASNKRASNTGKAKGRRR